MNITTGELAAVRDTTYELLGALGLTTYVFEVEPKEGDWALRVECAGRAGWETAVLPIERERVLASRADPALQAALLEEWRGKLGGCRLE